MPCIAQSMVALEVYGLDRFFGRLAHGHVVRWQTRRG